MATASSHITGQTTEFHRGKPLCLSVEVGAAAWQVVLTADALDALAGADHARPANPLSCRATDRLMDAVRAKAIRLHWYGGGTMTIEAGELLPARPVDDGDASPAGWYRVTATHALPERPGHLRAVA